MKNAQHYTHTHETDKSRVREKTDLEDIKNFLYRRKLVKKSQVSTPKSMHIQESF